MYLEAVTVCVNYGDFLAVSAAHNRGLFARWIVVTDPKDNETREVCRRFNLECITSEEGQELGGFNKGRLIERGLQHVAAEGWRLHIDADIILPANLHNQLTSARLCEDTVYGCDRVMCRNWDDWVTLRDSGYLQSQHDYHHRIRFPDGYTVGSRWASAACGYVPIGFFQMWHSSVDLWRGIRARPYPQAHNTACRTDVQFGLEWDRRKRALLPEIIVAHLESHPAPMGANWKGRTTRRFGPPEMCPPPKPCPS